MKRLGTVSGRPLSRRAWCATVAAGVLGGVHTGCRSPGAAAVIVAGTTLVRDVVASLSVGGLTPGGTESLDLLVPGGACPGHYDVSPRTIATLAACRALLLQPWQRAMANVTRALAAARLPADRIHVIAVDGNWMVPPVLEQAVRAASGVLVALGTPEAETARLAASRCARIGEVADTLRQRLDRAAVRGLPVFANEMIAPVVAWMGCEIAQTFGRAEEASVADLERLRAAAADRPIKLVVDNVQSGDPRAGEALARDLGVPRAVLTNFPGGLPGTDTWETALSRNVELVAEAAPAGATHGG